MRWHETPRVYWMLDDREATACLVTPNLEVHAEPLAKGYRLAFTWTDDQQLLL